MSAHDSSVTALVEHEWKYDVDSEAILPAAKGLPGVASVRVTQIKLVASYFDLPSYRLARAGITLRRRDGGHDAGWHLKIPAGLDQRTEYHVDLNEKKDVVPAELLDLIRPWLRGDEPIPVADLIAQRHEYVLLDAERTPLAAVTDDRVQARVHPVAGAEVCPTEPTPNTDELRPATSTWREWEVEILDASGKLQKKIDRQIQSAGATRSRYPSKLARALGPTAAPPTIPDPSREATADAVIWSYLAVQVRELMGRDHDVRHDVPTGIHQMRVATRRLRSVLGSFGPLFDPAVIGPLRAELRWLAQSLGRARDLQVLTQRLNLAVLVQPKTLVPETIRQRLMQTQTASYQEAFADLTAALASPRYFDLIRALETLAAEPPFTEQAKKAAKKALPPLIAADWKKLHKAARALARQGNSAPDQEFHKVRKVAKRARYAAEAVVAAFAKVDTLVTVAKELQELLGDHQDSVVSRTRLLELSTQAFAAGENTFGYGRLHSLEETIAAALEQDFVNHWRRLAPRVKKAARQKR